MNSRLLGAATVAGLLVGCGPRQPAGTIVVMYDNRFNAPVTRVPVGTPINFINHGGAVHAAAAVTGGWTTGDVPAHSGGSGAGGVVTFDSAGVFRYYCPYHGTKDGKGMAGTIVVGDVEYALSEKGSLAPATAPSGITRRVPSQYPSIQVAVDAASPGDLILVDQGVYREEVTVTTPSLVIRGADRNETIIDGEFVRGNGIMVLADQVAVENLTARNHLLNGFFWTGVNGFRGAYLTAYNNGDYGIYAFGSQDGLFEQSYASGSPDSGFYIGECFPCRVVIRHVLAERNGLGFSGTNAGGALYVVSSTWRFNRAGIVPSSLDIELNPPQRAAVFAKNLVYSNNNRGAPAIELNLLAFGNGILLAGSVDDTVTGNVVVDHRDHGVITAPIMDKNYYRPHGNVVRDNVVLGSGRADLANAGPGATGNCFAGNTHASSVPLGLERLQGCGGVRAPWWSDLVPLGTIFRRAMVAAAVAIPDWKTQPAPPPQPNLPEGGAAPVVLARDVFGTLRFDLATATLPPDADGIVAAARTGQALPSVPAEMTGGGGATLLSRLGGNAAFLLGPVVLGWWVVRGFRRRHRPTDRPWRRRLVTFGVGAAVYLLGYLASALYFARM